MSSTPDFTKMVPGFDFLQNLVKNASAALPGVGQWVAPTLDPAELEKRINDLRTVQYWLEQNARMLGTTIQALEVQRMTLSTLKTMNVQMDDLRESLKINPLAAADASKATPKSPKASAKAAAAPLTPGSAVDPMQWWGALTQQFNQIAVNAMKDSTTEVARNLASEMVKQGFDAAGKTLRQTVAMPATVARNLGAAGKAAAGAAVKAAGAKADGNTSAKPKSGPAARKRTRKAGASGGTPK